MMKDLISVIKLDTSEGTCSVKLCLKMSFLPKIFMRKVDLRSFFHEWIEYANHSSHIFSNSNNGGYKCMIKEEFTIIYWYDFDVTNLYIRGNSIFM